MCLRKELFILLLLALVLPFDSKVQAESPLTNADYLWQFASSNEAGGKLVSKGKVELGVALPDDQRVESLLRGGDGRVARFQSDSYLSYQPDPTSKAQETGQYRTFCVRFRSDTDRGNYPIFSRHGGHQKLAWNFFYYASAWGFELGTTENKKLLTTRAPFAETRNPKLAATQWHDLIGRVTPAKMELFLDGRCVDEDFLLGVLRAPSVGILFGAQYIDESRIEPGFTGDMDYAALWNRALSDEEIGQLSGGPDRMDSRARTDRGNGESLQYWCPPNQYGVGDCMPFSHDGVFHFMYLLDKGRHGSKNGFGAHQWIQATSTDLVHWKHQPFVVPIDDQNEGSICTGSMFVYKGTYYAFYANRSLKFTTPDNQSRSCFGLICVSTSTDGIHFTKSDKNPLFYLQNEYGGGTRDPIVFTDPQTGQFHMYVTTKRYGIGCLAHLSSDDLFHWTLEEPVYTSRNGEPECADVFEWGGTWYLIVGHTNGYYRVAKSPLGPWEQPATPNVIMPGIVNVPKTAPWKDNRRIVCAWSREHGFGGHAVFHELVRRNDGTLGEKFVPEMIPATGTALVQEKNRKDKELRWEKLPGNLRIQAEWSFDPAARDSLVGCAWSIGKEKTISIEPGRRLIQLGDFRLENVDFSSGRIQLDLIIQGDLIDLCVNNDRAVIDTLLQLPERTIILRQREPERLKLESLTVSPLR